LGGVGPESCIPSLSSGLTAPVWISRQCRSNCASVAGMDVAEWAIAVGTLGTAVAAVLGLRSAVASARTAQHALAAQWQPLLIDVPIREDVAQDRSLRLPGGRRITIPDQASTPGVGEAIVQATGDHGEYLAIPFRNVGSGVGRIVELSLYLGPVETACHWRIEQSFLAPGESTRAVVTPRPDSPARAQFIDCARQGGSGISVGVAYSDLSGRTRGEVIFALSREENRGWHVEKTTHHVLPFPIRKTVQSR
jgi:hypothetical protein